MTDDAPTPLAKRVAEPDTRFIDLESRGEVEYWLKVFDVSKDELLAAISEVGPYAGAVAIHLKSMASMREEK